MRANGELFSGERLQLAREFQSLTQKQLALEVSASPALISLYESGKKKEPAPDLIQAFADVLEFEQGFFYQPVDDLFRENECSFRHRRSTPERLKSQIRAHATLIGMVVEKLRSHLKFPVVNIPNFRASSVSEIELAADQCRTYWDIGLDAPLVHVARAMEHAGIIIVPHVANSKVDAFSRFGRNSVIFLNKTIQSTSRWNFDIAHECGHLVLHVGIPTGNIETEAAADRFAGAFLMPRKGFERDFTTLNNSFWTKVFELKRRWRASAAAIVRRAYDLNLIGAVQYRQAFKYMSYQGWRTQGEPYEPQFQDPELLLSALNALGTKVDITTEQLYRELNFRQETFRRIVGLEAKADRRTSG